MFFRPAAHLRSCSVSVVPPSQHNVMVLEDNDLRDRPVETMTAVWDFIGLPRLNVSTISTRDVYRRCVCMAWYPVAAV